MKLRILYLAAIGRDVKEREGHSSAIRVGMRGAMEFHTDSSFDHQLFAQLTLQAHRLPLSFQSLTSGELPFQWVRIFAATLANQQPPPTCDHTGGNANDRRHSSVGSQKVTSNKA